MTTTAVDEQWAVDRDAIIDEMARVVEPMEWRGSGHMRYAGHTITWEEYVARRHEPEEEFTVEPLGFCMDCGSEEGQMHHHNCASLERDARWSPGEERIDRIAQSDASGDHYQQGRKDDAAKPRLDLLLADMPHALEAIARVLTLGAEKYAPGNWMDVPDAQRRYLAAGARHELEFAKGVLHDAETGEHHLAHAACCLLFRLELLLREDF